jgi:hypothetical protein
VAHQPLQSCLVETVEERSGRVVALVFHADRACALRRAQAARDKAARNGRRVTIDVSWPHLYYEVRPANPSRM